MIAAKHDYSWTNSKPVHAHEAAAPCPRSRADVVRGDSRIHEEDADTLDAQTFDYRRFNDGFSEWVDKVEGELADVSIKPLEQCHSPTAQNNNHLQSRQPCNA